MYLNRLIIKFIVTFLAFASVAYAQKQPTSNESKAKTNSTKAEESQYEKKKDFSDLRDQQKLDKEEMFKSNAVPVEWQDESVVILAFKKKIYAIGSKSFPIQHTYIHIRFKLNDVSAVEGFSDYEFDDGDLVEIKIVKADGKVKKVNLDDAVSENAQLKINNKYSFSLTGEKKKIALKDLEVGDIVDFSALYRNSFVVNSGTVFLPSSAPIVSCKYQFNYLKAYYAFSFKAFNGCPEYTNNSKGNMNDIIVEASMVEKEKAEILSKPSFSQPYFKFQLIYTTSDKNIFYYPFHITRKEVKTSVTEEDLKYSAYKSYKSGYTYNLHITQFNKKMNLGSKPAYNREYFEKFYYYLRDHSYTKELAFANEYSNVNPMYQFYTMAKKAKLTYEIILAIPKHVGGLENVLFQNEVYTGVRIHFPGEEPLLVFEFGPFTHVNEYNHIFEGTDIYVFTQLESLKKIQMTKEKFPVSEVQNNAYQMAVSAVLNPDLSDTLSISQRTTISGHFKNWTNSTKGLNYFDFYTQYKEMLTELGYHTEKKPLYFFPNKGVYEFPSQTLIESEEQRIENVYRERQAETVKKRMKAYAEDEFHVYDYTEFSLLNDGRSAEKKSIEFEENLKIGSIVDKADGSYILHVGKIFGSLSDISNSIDRKDRKSPFVIDFNRIYSIKVELHIPAGVTVSGLQNLNADVDNEVGHFTVKAEQKGNVIEVTMSKEYKAYRYEAEQWNKYLEFSDAGAAFINKKLILTR